MKRKPADVFIEIMIEERERRNLSHSQLAARLNLPPKTLLDWERGKRYPRLSSAIAWADLLGFGFELERRQ